MRQTGALDFFERAARMRAKQRAAILELLRPPAMSGKPRQNMVYGILTGIRKIFMCDPPSADGCGRLLECRHPARQSSRPRANRK
jgi:hypothetical protein